MEIPRAPGLRGTRWAVAGTRPLRRNLPAGEDAAAQTDEMGALPRPDFTGFQAGARPWERAWDWRASCRACIIHASLFPVTSM